MFERVFSSSTVKTNAVALYLIAVEKARQPNFYAKMGVSDSVDGRFDMIALHVFLLLRRLRQGGEETQIVSQALFDTMFEDMDRGLRELGAGDLGVGRRVKSMAKAFYGRIAAYDEGLDGDDGALVLAIKRNIFRGSGGNDINASEIAHYMQNNYKALQKLPLSELLSGRISCWEGMSTGQEASDNG